jgi:hypothetical protein
MRCLLIAAALLLTPAAVQAQFVEIYGTLVDAHATNVPQSTVVGCAPSGSPCLYDQFTKTSVNNIGLGGGLTLNLIRLPVLKFGVDVRGSRNSATSGLDTALAGLKLTIHFPGVAARPYIQGSIGYVAANAKNSGGSGSATSRYFADEALAGVDLPILRVLDFRILELGLGRGVQATTPTFVTVASGLVLHF